MPFLEDYVEIGVDGLQSFQPTEGNDLETATADYRGRLTFITGIDILSGESQDPETLAKAIRNAVAIGSGGRFILATTHMVQHTMPVANYRAIFETVRQLQRDTGASRADIAAGAAGAAKPATEGAARRAAVRSAGRRS